MSVLSPEHHSRHLSSEEEKAQFARTAPIETPEYWDLIDEVHRADSDPEKIRVRRERMSARIGRQVIPGRDEAVIADSTRTMNESIRSHVRDS